MKVVSIINHKGGVGKSTICLNLAFCYANGGLRVCIIDSDVQGSISTLAKMVNTSVPVLPYSALQSIGQDSYDLVLVDTPPYHTSLTVDIIRVSDFILLPVKPSYFDVLAMKPTIELINQTQQRKPLSKTAIVLNMVKQRTSLNNEMRDILVDYSSLLLNSFVSERVSYVRSSFFGNGVFGSDDSKAKEEITDVASEVLQRMNPISKQL